VTGEKTTIRRGSNTWARLISACALVLLLALTAFGQVDEAKQAIERGEFVRAVNILSQARNAQPSADVFLYLGIAYGNMKEYQKAEEALTEGAVRYPDDSRFHTELAGVYFATQAVDKARAELNRALSINSSDRYASDLLASIDMSRGDTETALRYWNKTQQPVIDDILHNYYLNFGSSVVRDAVAFRPAGVLKYDDWKTTEARLFATNNFVNVGLEVEPTRVPDRYDAIIRTSDKTNSLTDVLWNGAKGLPYQTNYVNFWNIGNSGVNWNSFYRWDGNRHGADGRLQVPLLIPGILQVEFGETWRSERWNLTPSIRPQFAAQGSNVRYRGNALAVGLSHIPHYRFEWGGGFAYANRYAQGDIPQIATNSLNSALFLANTSVRLTDRSSYRNRLHIEGFLSRKSILSDFNFGGGTAELNNRITFSKPQREYLDWTIKGGTSRGSRPFEEYFMLGLDLHPQNLLRGHKLAKNGLLGNGPTGTDFVLGNLDYERRLVTLPLFNTLNLPFVVVKAEVFLDSGKIWDRTNVFQNSKLLVDTGAGLKFETPTGALNVVYGRSLRDGQSVLIGYIERRIW
jgi:tetratricopeptide (TPR) repeat protein